MLIDISRYCSSFVDDDMWPSSLTPENKSRGRESLSSSPVLRGLPLPPADWSLSSSFSHISLDPPFESLWSQSSSSSSHHQHKPCDCCRCTQNIELWSLTSGRQSDLNESRQTQPVRPPRPIKRPSPGLSNLPSSLTMYKDKDEDDGTLRLHVSNIPFQWSKEKLAEIFGQYGTTFDVEVVYNERGSKGFGFVTFLAKKDALEAKRRMDREIVDGRRLVVNFAKPKQKTSGSHSQHQSFASGLINGGEGKGQSYSSRSNRVLAPLTSNPLGFSTPPTLRRQHLTGFSSLSSTPTRPTSSRTNHRYYL